MIKTKFWQVYKIVDMGEEAYLGDIELPEFHDPELVAKKKIFNSVAGPKKASVDWDNHSGYIIDKDGKDVFRLKRVVLYESMEKMMQNEGNPTGADFSHNVMVQYRHNMIKVGASLPQSEPNLEAWCRASYWKGIKDCLVWSDKVKIID